MFPAARVWVLFLCFSSPAVGQAAIGPQELVKETTDQTISRLQHEREALQQNPDGIYDLVKEIITPHFDFVRISAWVLSVRAGRVLVELLALHVALETHPELVRGDGQPADFPVVKSVAESSVVRSRDRDNGRVVVVQALRRQARGSPN